MILLSSCLPFIVSDETRARLECVEYSLIWTLLLAKRHKICRSRMEIVAELARTCFLGFYVKFLGFSTRGVFLYMELCT
jgi:hypothetical protein